MQMLRVLREAFIPTIYQDLPSLIKAKVNLIEELYAEAMLYQYQFEEESLAIPDIDAYIRNRRQRGNSEEMSRCFIRALKATTPLGESSQEKIEPPKWGEVILMADLGYEPNSDLYGLAGMLGALWGYWIGHPDNRSLWKAEIKKKRISARAADFEAALDLSLTKLALKVGIETTNIRHWAKKKEPAVRVNLSQRIQTSNKVMDAFHQVLKKQGDTLNRIVNLIYKYLIETENTKIDKRGRISPGKKTIERALSANKPLMDSCFKKEKRGQMERIIYIGHPDV